MGFQSENSARRPDGWAQIDTVRLVLSTNRLHNGIRAIDYPGGSRWLDVVPQRRSDDSVNVLAFLTFEHPEFESKRRGGKRVSIIHGGCSIALNWIAVSDTTDMTNVQGFQI